MLAARAQGANVVLPQEIESACDHKYILVQTMRNRQLLKIICQAGVTVEAAAIEKDESFFLCEN